ncbi:MAG: SDR family oxidoreductase [Sphingomonadaceae bacterium]|jgi:NAD(P)-dependent dehydrogenase (short-subunit alcohol dehydrogenase family)|nr:SDR family oxidoreductase [Sphingomonadaceae bacterium]
MLQPVAIITGAAGGMGAAIARLLGHSHRLLLNDVARDRLDALVQALRGEGMDADGLAGDLAEPGVADRLAALLGQDDVLRSVVNAAGLSPIQADWQSIVAANAIGPARLLAAVDPLLGQGTACVMIASVAGHLGPRDATAEAALAAPLQPGLCDALAPMLAALAEVDGGSLEGHAYSLTKRAIIRRCEENAGHWGARGARIVSLSPGMILTPMGRREAESGRRAQALVDATPAGRWGTADDIAATAQFLLSDAASYISGCDIRVDGGAVAALRGRRF